MTERVQWYSGGSGSGLRSWALYGVTKVHQTDDGIKTLCGVYLPSRRSKHLTPDAVGTNECQRCAKALERK